MEKVVAKTFLEIACRCPYCGALDDKVDELRDYLNDGELRADSCDAVVKCSECEKEYKVEEIEY